MNRIVSIIEVTVALIGGLAIVTPLWAGSDQLVVAKVDTLNCGSPNLFLAGGFTVANFSFDSTHDATFNSGGRVTSAPADFGDFTVTKSFDACSPLLFAKMASGQHIPQVTLSWTSGIGSDFQFTYLTITLDEVLITAWNFDGGGAGQEAVSFSWSKITIKFYSKKADGSLAPPIQTSWDRSTSKL